MSGVGALPEWEGVDLERSHTWTREQHRQMACDILDGQNVHSVSEPSYDGQPPHRRYTSIDDDVRGQAPTSDPGPLLAAIAHAILANAEAGS